jgi:hypothetical protein
VQEGAGKTVCCVGGGGGKDGVGCCIDSGCDGAGATAAAESDCEPRAVFGIIFCAQDENGSNFFRSMVVLIPTTQHYDTTIYSKLGREVMHKKNLIT